MTEQHTQDAMQAIHEHARALGADPDGTAWAAHTARQAILHGVEPAAAILRGMNELRLWIEHHNRINREVADSIVSGAQVIDVDRVRDAGMEAHA
ncbi:MAG: hypothetical protein ABEH64_13005 [Salinirussus sp.]